jgi:hypothetical protein
MTCMPRIPRVDGKRLKLMNILLIMMYTTYLHSTYLLLDISHAHLLLRCMLSSSINQQGVQLHLHKLTTSIIKLTH